MMGVPANYLFIAQEPGFASADLSSLRRAVVGGARCRRRFRQPWQSRGVEIVQGYGLTEAAPNVLCLPPEEAVRKAGVRGQAVPARRRPRHDDGRAARRACDRRARRPRPERVRRLLARRGDRGRVRRRLAPTGDVAERGRRGLLPDRRPRQGHVISGGENVYPGRGRVVPTSTRPWRTRQSSASPTRAGARRDRLRRPAPRRATAAGSRRVCRPPGALQDAERGVPLRAAAVGDGQGAEGGAVAPSLVARC